MSPDLFDNFNTGEYTWERPIILLFESFPQSTGAQDMAVMASAAKIRICVEKVEIWAGHTQHVEAVGVVAVDVIHLHSLGGYNLDVGSVKAARH